MKRKTPFKALSGMDEKAEKVENYVITKSFEKEINNSLKRYDNMIVQRDLKLKKEAEKDKEKI